MVDFGLGIQSTNVVLRKVVGVGRADETSGPIEKKLDGRGHELNFV